MLAFNQILKNNKYKFICLELWAADELFNDGLKQKHLRYQLMKNHGLHKYTIREMRKYYFKNSKIDWNDLGKDYEMAKKLDLFNTPQDLNNYLKRLYPYVKYDGRSKKYFITDFFKKEFIRYRLSEMIQKDEMSYENEDTFRKDGKLRFSFRDPKSKTLYLTIDINTEEIIPL